MNFILLTLKIEDIKKIKINFNKDREFKKKRIYNKNNEKKIFDDV